MAINVSNFKKLIQAKVYAPHFDIIRSQYGQNSFKLLDVGCGPHSVKLFKSIFPKIEDNGIGRVKAGELNLKKQHKSLGTIITQEMFDTLHKIKDTDYSVEIIDLYDDANFPKGTKVIIRMELN